LYAEYVLTALPQANKNLCRLVPWDSSLLQFLGSVVDSDTEHPNDIRKLHKDSEARARKEIGHVVGGN